MEELTGFLKTYSSFYPPATEKELSYYIRDNVLSVIEKNYTFSELVNLVLENKIIKLRCGLQLSI